MNIMTLDLGTKTGWALRLCTGELFHGVEQFKPSRYSGGGMRFLMFRQWLSKMNDNTTGGINAVYFEEVRRHAGTDAAHVYGGFLASLTEWCEVNNIPYNGIPVGTIKKAATGKGNSGKDWVIASVNYQFGLDVKDDNEADALAIMLCVDEMEI